MKSRVIPLEPVSADAPAANNAVPKRVLNINPYETGPRVPTSPMSSGTSSPVSSSMR